ncbi:MAG: hypothetical protein AB7I50_14090 [Vicinamibacterales bacterium]
MRFNLGILSTRLAADLADLTLLADQASGATGRERNAIGEYCLVQIQDSWSRFVRDLILRSSLGNASRADGTKIPPGVHGRLFERDARQLLKSKWSAKGMGKDWEPAWTSRDEAGRAIQILQPLNANDIMTALGASTNPITEVKPLRNFVAHRGHVSADKLEVLAGSWSVTWRQPSDLCLRDGTGLYRFEQWCIRFQAVANAAVK